MLLFISIEVYFLPMWTGVDPAEIETATLGCGHKGRYHRSGKEKEVRQWRSRSFFVEKLASCKIGT